MKQNIKWLFLALLMAFPMITNAQQPNEKTEKTYDALNDATLRFVVIADIHYTVDNPQCKTDFQALTKDIMQQDGIAFILVLGDVAHRGDLASMKEVKQMLDKTKIPYYVVPGNHDCLNNGVGDAYFREVFGDTRFRLLCNGNLFLGINTAQLRSGDAHIAPEDIEWVKKQLKNSTKKTPVYVVTHHPLQSPDCDNWYQLTDVVRRRNLQTVINGHYHHNLVVENDNITGIICGTSKSGSAPLSSYTLCTMTADSLHFFHKLLGQAPEQWTAISTGEKFYNESNPKLRPSMALNKSYKNIVEKWDVNLNEAIYGSATVVGENIYVATHNGGVHCLTMAKGAKSWSFNTSGSILGSPAANEQYVVVADVNHHIYCLNAKNGALLWDVVSNATLSATPVIHGSIAYVACTDGKFLALNLHDGSEQWKTSGIDGVVSCTPLIADNAIYFTTWNGRIYALNLSTGTITWQQNLGNTLSIGAVSPVADDNNLYLIASGSILVVNKASGRVVWQSSPATNAAESIGISTDKTTVYTRTKKDKIYALNTATFKPSWITDAQYGDDTNPCNIVEKNGIVISGSKNGVVCALSQTDGSLLWQHKIGNSAINTIVALGNNTWIVTTTNGDVVMLKQE